VPILLRRIAERVSPRVTTTLPRNAAPTGAHDDLRPGRSARGAIVRQAVEGCDGAAPIGLL